MIKMRFNKYLNERKYSIDRYGNKNWDHDVDFIKEKLGELFKSYGYKITYLGLDNFIKTIVLDNDIAFRIYANDEDRVVFSLDDEFDTVEDFEKNLVHYKKILNIIKKNEDYIYDIIVDINE